MRASILALVIALSSCAALAQDLTSYPPKIQEELKDASGQCKEADDGKISLNPGVVQKLDLTGNKRDDYIVDLGEIKCSTAESLYCGTGGCPLSIYVRTKSGELRRIFSDQVRVYKISKGPGRKTITFDLHGGYCGKAGAYECPKKRLITEQPFAFKQQ